MSAPPMYVIGEQATPLVLSTFDSAIANANSAYTLASAAIGALQSFAPTINVSGNVQIPGHGETIDITGLLDQKPTKPGNLIPVFPGAPASLNFNTITYGTIPDMPDVDLNQVAVPTEVINTAVERYASTLLTEIKTKLLDRIVNGGTGLSPAIETAIWNRDQERALLALEDAKTRAADDWSKRGFTLPNGILMESLSGLEVEYVNKRLEVSRDIGIKQADLEQTNVNSALQMATQLESVAMNYHSQFCELMFRATEALQKAKIDIYTVWTAFYKAYVESIKNYSEAISDQARTEMEVNKDLLGRYGADLEKYKAQVTAEVERIGALLKGYAEDVNAFQALSGAYQAVGNVEVEELRALIQQSLGTAQVQVSAAAENIRAAIAYANVEVQAMIAAGHTAAQLAAGAMAGTQVSASIGTRVSLSSEGSVGESISHKLQGKSNQGS